MEKQPPSQPSSKLVRFLAGSRIRIVLGVLALGLSYVFASWAIDSGSLLDYAITALLAVLGVRDLIAGIKGVRGRS